MKVAFHLFEGRNEEEVGFLAQDGPDYESDGFTV